MLAKGRVEVEEGEVCSPLDSSFHLARQTDVSRNLAVASDTVLGAEGFQMVQGSGDWVLEVLRLVGVPGVALEPFFVGQSAEYEHVNVCPVLVAVSWSDSLQLNSQREPPCRLSLTRPSF
jgi:hypothetical protein